MAEQEAFEDELFADLYADEEPAKGSAAAPVHDAPSGAPPAAVEQVNTANDANQYDNQHQNGDDSYMNQDEYEEDEDEVDFNLGNDSGAQYQEDTPSTYSAPLASAPPTKGPNAKEDGKMFIGGLNWETTDQSLRDYFSQFGEVVECTVMRDGATGRSRGFGFLTFKDPKTVNIVMVKEHFLDGKIIDPKRAIPRDEQEKTSKIFVGGVSQETTDHEFREYFAQFGRVVDATLMMDKDTGRPRGFGFVTFESEAGVDACLDATLEIHGKPIEVKKAQPRGNLREDEEAQRRGGNGKFARKGQQGNGTGSADENSQGTMNAMSGGGQGNMTPQMFAQYMQRMQQAFNMMQQQMAMSRGMGSQMNPMMQMMQMQQMQNMQQMMAQAQAGRGAGNPMGGMTPQMMQQMQQMQQQMMAQQGGGSPQVPSGPAGPGNRQGFGGGFDQQQQQQQFDQQKFGPRGQQGGGGGYGGNQQGYNPTSWEGMYDDVPQPMMNQGGPGGGRGGFQRNRGGQFQNQAQNQAPRDPNQAPPANAPTGPKNAGKPGANYRGGGRGGGNRGFHPYGRG